MLPRTDGRWAIIDERRAPGDRTIMTFKTLAEADVSAKAWHEQGHG